VPNIFGGDQLDEDYAPHLYEDEKHMEDKTKSEPDPRIRVEIGEYRVVAPNGRAKDGRFYVNGALTIEKRSKDALGNRCWTHVAVVSSPGIDCKDEFIIAIYRLLAGPGAE
jgi:hypothetical protein